MEQLAYKCHSLETLKFFGIGTRVSSKTRSMLLKFAAHAITSRQCFNTLFISQTESSVSDGANFFQTLEDSKCSQLTTITISKEVNWFAYSNRCMDPLCNFLARQTELQALEMEYNALYAAQ